MRLKQLELIGFKSFAKKSSLTFSAPITAIVGPNGSGKSNVAEAFRWVLGEQSMKSLRGKRGEDLIWNGSAALPAQGRAAVTLTFDNHDRVLPVTFDEVAITREVHRDGENEYSLNRSRVRLKDVLETVASIGLGPTGHHIISQGEADRVLRASPREREQMIEDALSLKLYHVKIAEAQKKLEKAHENMKELELLRRELAPHLKFLEKHMERARRAEELRAELAMRAGRYCSQERALIDAERAALARKEEEPKKRIAEIDRELARTDQHTEVPESDPRELEEYERQIALVVHKREEQGRALGRIEGSIAVYEAQVPLTAPQVAREDVDVLLAQLKREVAQALHKKELNPLMNALATIGELIEDFIKQLGAKVQHKVHEADLARARTERTRVEAELARLRDEEERLKECIAVARKTYETSLHAGREAERTVFALRTERAEQNTRIESLVHERALIESAEARLKEDYREFIALLGGTAFTKEHAIGAVVRKEQEVERVQLERMKIKLEELGGVDSDVQKEYRETAERDAQLARELEDLRNTEATLTQLTGELKEQLTEDFRRGIVQINEAFQKFFATMFGGGTASLSVIMPRRGEEGEEEETGIEIHVALPRKRIRGIHMLSGGERALTSIALLFAMSQVNPPPFLILDETDAALDEANSRRYGDMIEELSKVSQLIVITHNRETMSRAGVLYGITMGTDSASKLLSIKFEEAEQLVQ